MGGGDGGDASLPPASTQRAYEYLFKKSNQWIVVSSCDCDIISKAKGRG